MLNMASGDAAAPLRKKPAIRQGHLRAHNKVTVAFISYVVIFTVLSSSILSSSRFYSPSRSHWFVMLSSSRFFFLLCCHRRGFNRFRGSIHRLCCHRHVFVHVFVCRRRGFIHLLFYDRDRCIHTLFCHFNGGITAMSYGDETTMECLI